MNDYSGWKEKTASVTALLLDPNNPRIPDSGEELSQRDIVAELIEHDNVYELARDIADMGFFPTEVLIGVSEHGSDVIVEGNRRLASLKLLISPTLAPEPHVKKFRALHERISLDAISKVRVSIAPLRDAAAPLIINRHTRIGVDRWKPAQQAKFIRTLMRPGVSIDAIAKQFGMSRGELVSNLKTDTMYQIACNLSLDKDVHAIVRNPRNFNASVLERLVNSSKATDFLGVKFDDRGNLTGHIQEQEFKKAFGRMVSDIALGKEDTRTLNTSKQIEEYLSRFGSDAPDRSRKGSFTSDSLLGRASARASTDPQPVKTRGGAKRESIYLVPSAVKCKLANPRINDIFRELRRLRVDEYTNAVAVLLRIFLELIVGNYLDRTKKIDPILLRARTKDNKGNDWYPSLRQMLTAVLADADIKLPPLARKGLNKMVSNDEHPLSLDNMDQFVHNRYIAPSEKDLRKLWALLEPLVMQLLDEPAQASKAKAGK